MYDTIEGESSLKPRLFIYKVIVRWEFVFTMIRNPREKLTVQVKPEPHSINIMSVDINANKMMLSNGNFSNVIFTIHALRENLFKC